MRIESAATTTVPAKTLYATIADLRHRPQWLHEMSDVDAPAGPIHAGTRFTANSSLLLHTFHGVSDVKHADGDGTLVEEVHLGARFVSTWSVEPTATGSVVRHRIDLDLPTGPLGWAARLVLGWRLRRMSRRSLKLLSEVVSQSS
jgi:hypothetical protein